MIRVPKTRRARIAAIAIALLAFAATQALAASGGLSISPGIFKQKATPGTLGTVKVANTTAKPMAIALTPRPWLQSPSGEVTPDPHRTLGRLAITPASFRLAPGASREVSLSLSSQPPRGSLYGALELTGSPHGRPRNGVKVAYRLITSIRLYPRPGAQVLSAKAGRLIEQGSTRHGTLLLAVKNTGNTIVPITATVKIAGNGHVLRGQATAKTILPGATVNLPLAQLLGTLPRGRYTLTAHLTQGGHPLGTVKRHGVVLG